MNIVWMSWKDQANPSSGGAELVTHELLSRLAKDGHDVTLLTSRFQGVKTQEKTDGYTIKRIGGRWSVYIRVSEEFKRQHARSADLVVEEINTIPFFSKFYARKQKKLLFIHQLARQVWFYQMIFPLSLIGYLLEPVYLWLLRDQKVITVSNSTKQDLLRFGFKEENINIISEGIDIEPVKNIGSVKKYSDPTLLSLGSIRPMKRTLHQIKAFELVKLKVKNAKLKIAGDANSKYGQKVLRAISNSPYSKDIEYLGKVSKQQKIKLLQKCHIIMVTSVKEGWGLIVTEAASQGTPAIVYDVDGLRDSVQHDKTGLVAKQNTPYALGQDAASLLTDPVLYERLQHNGWEQSKVVTLEQSYEDFKESVGLA